MHSQNAALWPRVRQATGTVYGDIGTSVLYTIMEITREAVTLRNHRLEESEVQQLIARGGDLLSRNDLLGELSLVFWALIFLTIKYDLLIMRADHRGEGGTFALWSLLKGYTGRVFAGGAVGFLVVTAAALLAADGIITPPISMLGAFEPLGATYSVIITLLCLIVLFKVQWRGTSQVGGIFGWFMICVWFPWIALKGLPWICAHPDVFLAVNPRYAIEFLGSFPQLGFMVIMGVVVLSITGGEAKFADIGHFSQASRREISIGESLPKGQSGRIPVMYSWFMIVLPSLLISYAGQVAFMLGNGVPSRCNTFYALIPKTGFDWLDSVLRFSDMSISALAAIIASQALITGMFSIVKEATALGVAPRFRVIHTDAHGAGQVYIPSINWALFLGCVLVTVVFQTSGNLAAAYGVAVTGTMGITTIIFGYVAYYRWKWSVWGVGLVCIPILIVDLLFFGSNLLKLFHGGYFPVLVAAILVCIMLVWQWGRASLASAFFDFGVREGKRIDWLVSLRDMLDDLEITLRENLPAARLLIEGKRRLVESDRAVVFLCSRPVLSTEDYVPVVLRIFLKKYGVLPARVLLMHVNQEAVATIDEEDRYRFVKLGNDIHSVVVNYGYMEQPDVRHCMRDLQKLGIVPISGERWIIEVGEEDIIADSSLAWYQRWSVILFRFVLRFSTPAHKYLGLVYDAAVSKEVIPVVFARGGVRVALPELELTPAER